MRRLVRFTAVAGLAAVAGAAQAQTTVYQNDFQTSTTATGGTWSAGGIYDRSGTKTLGSFTLGEGTTLSVGLPGSATYTGGTFRFRLHTWDSWDLNNCCGPDDVFLSINGGPLVNLIEMWVGTPAYTAPGGYLGEANHDFALAFGPAGTSLSFAFVGGTDQTDERWSLDDVRVELNDYRIGTPPTSAVPEPATVVLMGTGLLALGVAARRRARK